MRIKVVDCKNNEVIKVKIEISKHMFIVVPEIIGGISLVSQAVPNFLIRREAIL